MIYAILLLAFAISLYLHITRNFNYWRNKNVHYFKPTPIFGNAFKLFTIQKSIGDFVYDLYKNGKTAFSGFFIYDQPFLLIRDPELIKMVLIKDFEHFSDRSINQNNKNDKLGSNLLFLLKNPHWRNMRVKLSPAFSTGKIKAMFPLILKASDEMIRYINRMSLNETSSDCRELAMRYTTDVIASCAFGINARSFADENAEFRAASKRVFASNFGRGVSTMSYFLAPTLVNLFKLKFIDGKTTKFMKDVFSNTMSQRIQNETGKRGDLVDILMQIKKNCKSDDMLSDIDNLIAQAVQFFVAGFETNGSTISFALYELALHQSVQDRLREEIRGELQKRDGITYEAVQELEYLDMTVRETLRKYPPLSFLDRRCTKTYQIPNTDVIIEKGIPIYISLLGLHYDSEYFPNPEKFDPERFSYENRSTMPKYVHMPFGEGLHNCIGKRLGVLTVKLALMQLLNNFKVSVTDDTPAHIEFSPKAFLLVPKKETLKLKFELCGPASIG